MLAGVPQLATWPLSGRYANHEAFQQMLLEYSQPSRETNHESLFKKWNSWYEERGKRSH